MSPTSLGSTFIGIGGFSLILTGVLYARLKAFLAKARPAYGTVTAIRTQADDDGDPIYAPVVEFRTENGHAAIYKSGLYSRPCKYKVGDKVDILYNPDKPADAQIKGRKMNFVPMLVLGSLGMIFTIFGVVLALMLPHRHSLKPRWVARWRSPARGSGSHCSWPLFSS